jgi:hypothetical protein
LQQLGRGLAHARRGAALDGRAQFDLAALELAGQQFAQHRLMLA